MVDLSDESCVSKVKGAKKNKLYCVGVGPGDPSLITIRGKEIIDSSEVIFCPVKSVHSESFALDIVKKICDLQDKEIYKLIFPMTTKEDKAKPYWISAYEKIREKIFEGKKCVFIVEGDPLLFSTFNNILNIIKERNEFDVEIVPGISSFQILASLLAIPIGDGDEIVVIMPASIKEKSGCRTAELRPEFDEILKLASTIFVFKSGRVIDEIKRKLEENKSKNGKFLAFFGELCGTENEFISPLEELNKKEFHYFSTLMLKKISED
jgi:precorrin-2/cobalt-factor-2 C20-methyltransferase